MIEASVMIPMFRAKYIGWLPFEGLIRQKHVPCEWEIIIAEEQNDPECFGLQAVMEYEEALRKVGCKRIQYLPLKKWIPLGSKLGMMVREVSPSSRIYVGNSADYYSAPERLARDYEAFSNPKVVQHLPSKAIHYVISKDAAQLQDSKYSHRKDHVVGRSDRMDIARRLPRVGPKQSVDGWLDTQFRSICSSLKIPYVIHPNNTKDWQKALSVFGFNNLSPQTGLRRVLNARIFDLRFCTEYPVRDIKIPSAILQKLRASRKDLDKHVFMGRSSRGRSRVVSVRGRKRIKRKFEKIRDASPIPKRRSK